MLTWQAPRIKDQALIGAGVFVLALWLAYEIGGKIAGGDTTSVIYGGLLFAACAVAVAILRNWRTGFYSFLGWLLFEDLARKYMGNGLALFFGKDILAALTYVSLFAAIRKGREKSFRPPFLLPLGIFVWLGAMQIFNSNSPHYLYGLLGFKVYFFYIPLMWVGYALIRDDQQLRKFLIANALVAIVIASVGIIQAVVGNSFLNPVVLAPELKDLGDLTKVTPISGQAFNLPDSVFVSTGRFAGFLDVELILLLGCTGYLLLHAQRGRKIVFAAIALVGAALLLSGSRGGVAYGAGSALILILGFVWGAPWKWGQTHRMMKAIRRSVVVGTLGLAAVLLIFPEQAASRIAFYSETLMPNSSAYEGTTRNWDYPLRNLMLSFDQPNWLLGNGLGVASLGRQYVGKILGQPAPNVWVEEGFGVLIVEMGVVGPFLWILWAGALCYSSWKLIRRLRGTRFFPIAFAVFWYAFLLLFIFTWGGLSVYQNYINNAYLWLLLGILYRLPELQASASSALRAGISTPQFVPFESTR